MLTQRYLLAFATVTLTYWATAVIGLRWSVIPGAGTAVWAASGVAFAALALISIRLWPAIVLGRMLTFATVGTNLPFWAELVISFGTTAAGVVPLWLINRERPLEAQLGNLRDMMWLVVGGAGLGAVISAGSGLLVLLLVGNSFDQAWSASLNWFFGYGVGLLVVAPLILAWWPQRREDRPKIKYAHFSTCIGLTATAAAYLFLSPAQAYFRPWHLFPLLVWAAVAFQVRGAAMALTAVAVFAVAGAIQGTGPLASDNLSVQVSTLLTQQFVGMIGATVLLLAAVVDERRDVEAAARLAAIVHSSPEAIISYDAKGRISSWNRGAELLFGYPPAEVLGRGGEILLPPEKPDGSSGVFGMAVAEGGPIHLETVRMSRSGKRINVSVSASPMFDPGSQFMGVAVVMRDITARRKAELHQRLLIGELNHRVKNSLAVIQSLAQQTFKNIDGAAGARAAFEGRLLALAAAHNVLTERSWENASFREIIETAVLPFSKAEEGRISVTGPDFMVRPQVALSFAMVLHELATNAVKYGSLGSNSGRVDIQWSFAEEKFQFSWNEYTSNHIQPQTSTGFGSKLIERTLKAEIGATILREFRSTGLRISVLAPRFDASDDLRFIAETEGISLQSSAVTVAI
jgi:PAS domain S-box-containing protein